MCQRLTDHPTRPTWQPGAGGLILHTIVPHPTDAARTWVGISAVGVFETRDGGASWEPRNAGVRADFNPDPHPVTGQCVHKFAAAAGEPETLYQQNHCGMYRLDDGGEHWTDLTHNGLPSQFGFPLVTHPRDPRTLLDHPAQRRRPGPLRARTGRPRSGGRTTAATRGSAARKACRRSMPGSASCARRWPATRWIRSGSRSGPRPGQLWQSTDEGVSLATDHRRTCRRSGRSSPWSWTDPPTRPASTPIARPANDGDRPAAALAPRALPGCRATARGGRPGRRGGDRRASMPGSRACATGSWSPGPGCVPTSTSSLTVEPADLSTPVAPGDHGPRHPGGLRGLTAAVGPGGGGVDWVDDVGLGERFPPGSQCRPGCAMSVWVDTGPRTSTSRALSGPSTMFWRAWSVLAHPRRVH